MDNFDDVIFVMPSSHRADNLITMRQFPKELYNKLILLVGTEEYEAYANAVKQWDGVRVQTLGESPLLAEKAQYMFTLLGETYRYVVRVEDDITLFVRDAETMKLTKATEEEVLTIFENCVDDLRNGYPLVGISNRGGNAFQKEDVVIGTRMHHIWFVDTVIFRKLNINICPFVEYVMDDFLATLGFLTNGYPNKVYFKYAVDDRGSNTPGGASLYRTSEVQHRSALWLAQQYPTFVTIKEKVTISGWAGMRKNANGQNVRTDVIISWKKAYEHGQSKIQRNKGFAFFKRSK